MLFKILLLIALVALAFFGLRKQERRRSAIRAHVLELDLHESRALNDQAVSLFCNRLSQGQSNVATLVEIVGVTRNHIATLEGRAPANNEGAASKTFAEDAKRIYRTTAEEAGILQGLQSYIYREPVSPEEIGELKDRLARMEAAF